MTYNICIAGSRKATDWQLHEIGWADFCDALREDAATNVGFETHAEYMAMPKGDQDTLKDVGGFVAGTLRGGKRRKGCCTARSMITLDMDNCGPGTTEKWREIMADLCVAAAVYTTRKHDAEHPRLRVILPLAREVEGQEEYPALARAVARSIDPTMAVFDRTTFEPERLMYWPSASADSDSFVWTHYGPTLDPDEWLELSYEDWHDASLWPLCPAEEAVIDRGIRQQDPNAKDGIVGAFCRTYDVPAAIAAFDLPYTEAGPGRYTYTQGSTIAGAVLYDNGKFLYSHHATDPAGGQLCNAWDLVRIHRFAGEADSNAAMTRFAESRPEVADRLQAERTAQALEGFSALPDGDAGSAGGASGPPEAAESPDAEGNWRELLSYDKHGHPLNTTQNMLLVMEHDPKLKGRIWLDSFANRLMCRGPFPWPGADGDRVWADSDDAGIRWYMDTAHRMTGMTKIADAVVLTGERHARHPVREYLQSLTWDGVERLDRLLIDYQGAEDTPYTRAVTRKVFVAAVARIFRPGTKFDQVLILSGKQGLGKSMLMHKMGRQWFSDSLTTFTGKEAREAVQGVWIIEMGELTALDRSETEAAKQFISQTADRYRPAYGRRTSEYPRQCVFFGTSNQGHYLRDSTGNRRYWPVDVRAEHPLRVDRDLTEPVVDQLWAEAVTRYKAGEPLDMDDELRKAAIAEQEAHREADPWEGIISEWLQRPIPTDWATWDADRRRCWWQGMVQDQDAVDTCTRRKICVIEVWCECLGQPPDRLRTIDSRRIGAILSSLPGWRKQPNSDRCSALYGRQKVWFLES